MSSHILEDIQRVCDEVAIIADGAIILHEDMETLLKSHAQPLVRLEFEHSSFASKFQSLMSATSVGISKETEVQVTIAETDFHCRYAHIMGTIVEQDLVLKSISKQDATLEDVFMHHMEERKHA